MGYGVCIVAKFDENICVMHSVVTSPCLKTPKKQVMYRYMYVLKSPK